MSAFLLAGMVCWTCSAQPDMLLKQLDEDFETILKAEKDPQPFRKAARLLEQTNQSDRWTEYHEALTLLRQNRSKAAFPLLMKYMVLHSGFSTGHVVIPAYADTLTILSGKDIPSPYRYVADRRTPVREAVEDLVKTWWTPNKEKLSADMGKMSREQVQVVVHRLLDQVEGGRRSRERTESTQQMAVHLRATLLRRHEDRGAFWSQDLHPSMIPFLLERCGYHEKPPEKPVERDAAQISFGTVLMLAELRRNGEAPDLDSVAGDKKQNSAVRLTCILSLVAAGEALKTKEVLEVLSKEVKVDRRVIAVLALGYSDEQDLAGPQLKKLLEDPNRDVRAAAELSLKSAGPK
jgi:hypothetical protein